MVTQSLILEGKQQLLPATADLPGLSVMFPFNPKMTSKADLNERLNQLIKDAQYKLEMKYPRKVTIPIANKLRAVVAGLDFTTYKRSVALFVSNELQHVSYLDIDVKETVIIDSSFHVRDIIYNKTETQKFLVLVLSAKYVKIYLGGAGKLTKIMSDSAGSSEAYGSGGSQKDSNFADPSVRKEIMLKKFLLQADASIGILLKAYRLPMFVAGDDRVVGHFKKVSRHLKSVIDYIHADLINASDREIAHAVKPYITHWEQVKQQYLLGCLETAASERKLSVGLINVWRDAMQKRGQLLIVERNYVAPAIAKNDFPARNDGQENYSISKDAIEDIIEKVLASGGDVEFVEDGYLGHYDKIALILHYQNLWS